MQTPKIDSVLEEYALIFGALLALDERNQHSNTPNILVDTLLRLAGIQTKHELEVRAGSVKKTMTLTVNGLTHEEATRLRDYFGVTNAESDETFVVAEETLDKKSDEVAIEILRQIKEEREALIPYVSRESASTLYLLGTSVLGEYLAQYENEPELLEPLNKLLPLVEDAFGKEDNFDKNANKIFKYTNAIINFANKHLPEDEDSNKEFLNYLKQMPVIEQMYLAKRKYDLEMSLASLKLDQNSHMFLSGSMAPRQEALSSSRYTNSIRH